MLRDILGEKATDDFIEELNSLFEQIKILVWKELRPWGEFFAVFKLPQFNVRHLTQRISTNLIHYKSNYIIVCSTIFLVQILLSPLLLLTLITIVLFSGYFILLYKKPITLGEITLNDSVKKFLSGFGSVILLSITGTLEHLIWSILYCLTICALHLLFRPRSVTSKSNKLYEQLELNGFNCFSKSSPDVKSDVRDVEDPPISDDASNINGSLGPIRKRNQSYNSSVQPHAALVTPTKQSSSQKRD